ncbi:MAG: hypothetical protein M3443_18700 [Actinomycetota bacterium]|nr:hypothetical protein [Actinomycetota bacterium]
MLGDATLPPLAGDADRVLWSGLFDLVEHLPSEHVIIGGVMVHLHGAVSGRQPARVTSDVDVLFDVAVVGSLREAVRALSDLGYKIDPGSPDNSAHRYIGPAGELVDVLAPAGVRPRPSLITTPPGRTIEVYGGLAALRHRAVINAHYGGRHQRIAVPDLPRAMTIKCAAYATHHRNKPAEAWNSRHLQDIVFLTSLIEDPEAILILLDPPPAEGYFAAAAVLDNRDHPAWCAAGESIEDTQLVWEFLRQDAGKQ